MRAGDSLYTYYSGVLNENAKIYDNGKEENTAYLTYSNEPNGSGTGKTPEEKVYDWTFKMGIHKVTKNADGTDKSLTGAKFVLSENSGLEVKNMGLQDGVPQNTDGLIALIANSDGTYTVPPAGYVGELTYVIEAGSATINGLDDATDYYLYETKAPDGYNLLSEPVKFTITAAYTEDGSALSDGKPTVVVGTEASSATLSASIVNKAGSNLPETGGTGTPLFYIVGGILVIGAAVLLITRKRMNSEK